MAIEALRDIQKAGQSAFPALPYAPGSFTVPTGSYVAMSRHLILTGTQRATLAGTATLRIS